VIRVDGLDRAKRLTAERIHRARDLTKPLKAGALALAKLVDDSFHFSRAPSGESWKPLKKASIKSRRRARGKKGKALQRLLQTSKPLVDTRRLRKSIFAVGTKSTIQFGARSIANYGLYHQWGTPTVPRRAFLPVERVKNQFVFMAVGPAAALQNKIKNLIIKYILEGR